MNEPVPDDEMDRPIDDARDHVSIGRDGLGLISRFVRRTPGSFTLSLIGGIGWSALVVGVTYVLGRVTDEVITPAFDGGVERSAIWWSMFALCLVAVLRGASVVVRRWYGSVTETVNQAELRREVGHRLLVMPMSSYRRHHTGTLLANADVDITNGTRLLMPLPFSLGVIALVIFALISLWISDPYFALVALVLFPLLAILSRIYTDRVSSPAALVQERLGIVSAIAHESFDGALTVKTLGREEEESERFGDAAEDVRTARLVVANLASIFEPLIQVLPTLGVIVLLVIGVWRVDQGAATAGDLVQAIALFGWLVFPMRIVGFMFESLPTSVVSVRRVDRVLAEPTSQAAEGSARGRTDSGRDRAAGHVASSDGSAGPDRSPDGLDLVVEDVSFTYEPDSVMGGSVVTGTANDGTAADSVTTGSATARSVAAGSDDRGGPAGTRVLDGVSFHVDAGEVVALVGATGSGKTTLMNLLVRLDDPDSGTIRVGGEPIESIDPDELRDVVSIAFQEGFLFATSIAENITMGATVDDDMLTGVMQRANVDRFVERLTLGADTIVGERGVTLSGGQRQRVALARALAQQPRILLLDDATSAVDPVIEAQILAGLRDGTTSMLIVAHRLSTIMLADRVVHLADGRVQGEGTHAELLSDPDYAALVHAYEADEAGDGSQSGAEPASSDGAGVASGSGAVPASDDGGGAGSGDGTAVTPR